MSEPLQCHGTDEATGSGCVLFAGHVGGHVPLHPGRPHPTPAEVRAMFLRLPEVDRALFIMGLQHKVKVKDSGRWVCGCGQDPCPEDEPTAKPQPVRGPHSRACGMMHHSHGPQCATDCPTCHGNRGPVEPQPVRVCGECGAYEGQPHGMTHVRHPQGGGGTNRPCSRASTDGPVHLSPSPARWAAPCCGLPVFELPKMDRLTTDPLLVTCPGKTPPPGSVAT